ncbi:sulfatase-like hydrolase/transferase [Armatimonas rosea]|uniref:Putative sulfatase n=1 Tax=Armatimonas rosea TaxID=685828 RepID=A0A7W9SQ76_ARMRO|nr:sulfatase-like hydrolase/transferase [Armatimonas rosea]MBB6050817.1 putative sulfatase [Armatimonas rosea]
MIPAPPPTTPPNIVFVLIDDMGYADLSCYGNRLARTENIDRLAREGVRFTQFYVSAPICSPSRTGLLTGQYPQRWRIHSFLETRAANTKRGMAQWLDTKAPSVARELQKVGYATGHFGKWHMGGQRDVGEAPLITEYGFDTSLTQFEGLGDRILPLLDADDGTPPKRYALGSDTLGRGSITWLDRSKVTGAFASRAQAFMTEARAKNKPFFVNLWLDDVHSPFFPPKAVRGDGSKKVLYNAVVQEMDSQLGPLLEYVRTIPNTIVIVASDNGPEPGAGSAGAFRGQKGNLYEGGIREPLIVWGPGLVQPGVVNEKTVVTSVDMFPSLLKLAGVAQAHDGEELSEALLGKKQPLRRRPIFWKRPPDRPGPSARERFPDLAVREGDWKLLCMADGSAPQLYDLKTDPGEAKNLAREQPERVRQLTELLLAWNKTLP